MNLLRKYLLKKVTNKNKGVKSPISFEQSESVLFLYDFDSQFAKLNEIQAYCKSLKKEALLVGFSERKRKKLNIEEEGVICSDDFDFFISPKTIFCKKMLVKDVDLVVNLADTTNHTLKLFLALCRSKHVVGRGGFYAEYTDFILNDTQKLEVLDYIKAAVHYLNKIE